MKGGWRHGAASRPCPRVRGGAGERWGGSVQSQLGAARKVAHRAPGAGAVANNPLGAGQLEGHFLTARVAPVRITRLVRAHPIRHVVAGRGAATHPRIVVRGVAGGGERGAGVVRQVRQLDAPMLMKRRNLGRLAVMSNSGNPMKNANAKWGRAWEERVGERLLPSSPSTGGTHLPRQHIGQQPQVAVVHHVGCAGQPQRSPAPEEAWGADVHKPAAPVYVDVEVADVEGKGAGGVGLDHGKLQVMA
jgi:hypothetical protein